LNYEDTIDYLFTHLPMFQRKGPAAYKNSLENTLKLDACYGHPHRKFKTIHVAGTNGKGSVAHMLASVLQAAGYKTGLYTSPHLKDFRERIRVNGAMISELVVVDWVENYLAKNNEWKIEPSFFEITVAMAFDLFAQQNVDIAIIEVGLGGRLDSTNIISPEVSVITNIGLDHTNLLGDTLEKIAAEKGGIIKKDVPVVVGTTQKETNLVFNELAKLKGAPVYFADQEYSADYAMLAMDGNQVVSVVQNGKKGYPELKLDLKGIYQLKNLPAVLKTVDILIEKGWEIKEQNVYDGLNSVQKNTGLLGRWQIIGNNPLVICDTGHNEDGIKAILKQIENTPYKSLHFIFGTVADKNPELILKLLPKNAIYYFVRANIERALNEKILMEKAAAFNLKGECYASVMEAFKAALVTADKRDLIFVGGSTFVVAEIL
jgi:dihydrofolate synthase/folylpolyglutamate synthase